MKDLMDHTVIPRKERKERDFICEMGTRRDAVIDKVIREGFAEEVTYEL